jgi:hypothetical protein
MEQRTYTAPQIYDSMLRQGFDEDSARIMAMAIGGGRVTRDQLRQGYQKLGIKGAQLPSGTDGKQDSNFTPNLTEGVGFAAGAALAPKWLPKNPGQTGFTAPVRKLGRGLGRAALPMGLGTLGSLGITALTDNNYYDRASEGQLLGDIAGSIGGGILGEKLGSKYGKAAQYKIKLAAGRDALKNMSNRAGGKVLGKAGGGLAGRLAGGTAGRAIGGVLGAAGGPAGSILLGTALGYLLPKIIGGGSKSVQEEDKKKSRYFGYEEPF